MYLGDLLLVAADALHVCSSEHGRLVLGLKFHHLYALLRFHQLLLHVLLVLLLLIMALLGQAQNITEDLLLVVLELGFVVFKHCFYAH